MLKRRPQQSIWCWRCARAHVQESCTLKKPCNACKEQHLTVLHYVAQQRNQSILMIQVLSEKLYIDRPSRPTKVMLEFVKVILHNGKQFMETYAILDMVRSAALGCIQLYRV